MHPITARAREAHRRFFPPPSTPVVTLPVPRPAPQPPKPSRSICLETAWPSEIVAYAAREYGLTLAELRSPCRRRPFILARRLACALLRKRRLTYQQIGNFVGVDHTTVMAAVRKARACG
jgi:hypothetical protein